jgi:hypothetical protein
MGGGRVAGRPSGALLLVLAFGAGAAPLGALAQEIEPRAYSASPVGTTFAVAAYGGTRGDVVFDASAPFSNVTAEVDTLSLGVGRVFALGDRQASLTLLMPYQRGEASGDVGDERRSVQRSGPGDLRLRFSTLLVGGPALAPKEFAARPRGPSLGASVVLVAPTGQYAADRLVNIGTNRWAAKPELGLTWPRGRWQFDLHAGVWLFTANDDFLGDRRRRQEPVLSLHTGLSYTLRPGTWIALGATHYSGGETSVDGIDDGNRQSNLRLGATLSTALGRGHSLKLTYSDGAVVRIGGDFRTLGLAWQYAWFD